MEVKRNKFILLSGIYVNFYVVYMYHFIKGETILQNCEFDFTSRCYNDRFAGVQCFSKCHKDI